jgi:hypothetical protein
VRLEGEEERGGGERGLSVEAGEDFQELHHVEVRIN